jgi:glutaredoxin 3
MTDDHKAILYRMVLPDHVCPFGVRAKQLLDEAGYEVEEHVLSTREMVDAFKTEHGVATTPQVFIDGKRIGGSDDLDLYLRS